MRLEKRDYELKLWKEGFCNEALERAVMKSSSGIGFKLWKERF
jgi:hypothetical protein